VLKNKNKIVKSKIFWIILLFILTVISRLLVIKCPLTGFGWDPGNFALAADSYSLFDGRPHLPGYFLHVLLIKNLSVLTGNHFASMITLSIFYSASGAVFLFLIVRKWLGQEDSILLTLLVMTNPFVWYYGSVAEIYAFDLFFGSFLIYMGLSPRKILFTPVLMAIAAGIRASSPVLLFPLYVYLWQRQWKMQNVRLKMLILSHLAGIVIVFIWLLPMMESAGGWSAYLGLYQTHYPVENISWLQNIYRFSSYASLIVIPVLIFWVVLLFTKGDRILNSIRTAIVEHKALLNILTWWLLPPLTFFILIHYSKGYLMLCVAAFLVMGILIRTEFKRQKILMIVIIMIQTVFFLWMPFHMPDPQTQFAPGQRQINPFRIWMERTGSDYLMTRSRLGDLNACYHTIEKAVSLLKKEKMSLRPRKEFLYLDPTCIVSARALQAQYPDIKFTKYLVRRPTQYGFHQGLQAEARDNLLDMLQKAIIVTRTGFMQEYLTGLDIHTAKDENTWTYFTIDAKDAVALAASYRNLFSRE
jgi:hypothetical protein